MFFTDFEAVSQFPGIIFMTSYYQRRYPSDYWSKSEDLECPIAKNTMSSKRFKLIKPMLHIADNQILLPGKMGKVLLSKQLNGKMKELGIRH